MSESEAIPAATLADARRGKTAAVQALLAFYYPTVRRLAYGLTGEHAAGRRVVREVMRHAVAATGRFAGPADADRWFAHHTVLTARRFAAGEDSDATLRRDPLVGQTGDPAYLAFVRALRGLKLQQREALLLHLGEGWLDRQLGVAMDCSTQAADMHLRAAGDAMRTIGSTEYQTLADRLAAAYQALTPASDEVRLETATAARARRWPKLLRACGCTFGLLVLLAAAGAAWWFWPVLEAWVRPYLR